MLNAIPAGRQPSVTHRPFCSCTGKQALPAQRYKWTYSTFLALWPRVSDGRAGHGLAIPLVDAPAVPGAVVALNLFGKKPVNEGDSGEAASSLTST